MVKIGIDFDNTIVIYDDLFHKIASEENLIPINFPKSKLLIRDYLRSKNKDELFTLLQAEVYGRRIIEASPANYVLLNLKELIMNGYEINIISHKSMYPYKGPKYNLHDAAMSWLEKNNFFNTKGIGLSTKNVFFNLTKEDKIRKIETCDCDYFIDDLPEILNLIKGKTKKILYDPKTIHKNENFILLKSWKKLKEIIEDRR